MKLIISGATGYIGAALLRTAAEHGHQVAVIVRQANADVLRYAARVETRAVIPSGYQSADALINLAGRAHTRDAGSQGDAFDAVNCAFALALADKAYVGDIGRFIQISTIGVHGNWSVTPIVEQSPVAPDSPYSRAKLAAEIGLRQRYIDQPERLAIVRPPMVYGLACPGNFTRLVGLVAKNWPLPFGAIRARRSFIYVANLVDFLLHVSQMPNVYGTYVLGDGSDYTLTELIATMSASLGRTATNFRCPSPLLRLAASVIGRSREMTSLTRPMQVDWHRARLDAQWTPPVVPSVALAASLARHTDQPRKTL